jgi:predicted ATP-grasp superfamily ATP-dependent carboligase
MRVLIWEYCSDGSPDAPDSLRREGRAMRSAVLADFVRCPGVEAVLLPAGLAPEAEPDSFRRTCRSCDWTLVIAPESGGILLDRCREAEDSGGRLLGPSSAAVRLSGDKWETARHLLKHGVPTPRCDILRRGAEQELPYPLVCKPRVGAGSQATFLVRDRMELARSVGEAAKEGFTGEFVVEPFVAGRAVSVAFLIGPNNRVALPAVEQRLSNDGRFRYLGGRLPLEPDVDDRARRLAGRALARVPGLLGYVGVDLVLGATAGDDTVIEINPRMTTSYVGLRALAEDNLAAALLAIVSDGAAPALAWRRGPISFTASGELSEPEA